MLELPVMVGMVRALLRLTVGLQTEPQRSELTTDRALVRLMAQPTQLRGEPSDAAATPEQWRLGISTGRALDQPEQVLLKLRVTLRDRLATRSRAPDPTLPGTLTTSAIPRRTVDCEMAVALTTAAMPPRPCERASAAA